MRNFFCFIRKEENILRLNEGNVYEDIIFFLVEYWIFLVLDSYKVC